MATEIKQKTGTQFCFADHDNDFNPTTANDLQQGTPNVTGKIQLAGVLDTEARQSTKVDLGATRAAQYSVIAALEFAATPVAGAVIELYWAGSPDATAGNGNPGGCTGADADYTGTAASSLAESVLQLEYLGVLVCTDDATATVQIMQCTGSLFPKHRYGSLVVKNESGANIHSDDVECHIILEPVIDESQ